MSYQIVLSTCELGEHPKNSEHHRPEDQDLPNCGSAEHSPGLHGLTPAAGPFGTGRMLRLRKPEQHEPATQEYPDSGSKK